MNCNRRERLACPCIKHNGFVTMLRMRKCVPSKHNQPVSFLTLFRRITSRLSADLFPTFTFSSRYAVRELQFFKPGSYISTNADNDQNTSTK